ncbi:MAG: bifunctional folylpolyglutamate synthase/dihydrofolate synthase [Eubacteriales bacterium]|nr:bifunctional folylpolyglutamate synthase/dihydrofolate synthase [Eubacteriales bacterium]
MDYAESRAYITTALTFGIRLGLARMQALLELLGQPQVGLRVIHIAGTNGKGSTSSYCASILAASGAKVGLYTSPYIERFTERIRIMDGPGGLDQLVADETRGEIGPDDFARIMTRIRMAVDTMIDHGEEHPTEFELITAAAFVHFQQQACDWVVLETGLGGRLDSTNVIARPQRVILTAIGYDHMDRLGDTLPAIAAEKAGIIKSGCPVFLYDPVAANPEHAREAKDALQVIIDRCRELSAPLTVLHPEQIERIEYQLSGQLFSFQGQTYRTRLLGLFQPLNAALAIQALQDLVPAAALASGIAQARWPARLEVFPGRPLVLVDGAHNPQGTQALGDALDQLVPSQPVVFVVGLLSDKDYPAMLDALWRGRTFQVRAIFCVTPDNPRALPADRLAETIMELKNRVDYGYNIPDTIHSYADPLQGLSQALDLAAEEQAAVCAFGSLYLVGHFRSRIRQHLSIDREDPLS